MPKIPKKRSKENKERAKGICEYCRSNSSYSESPFENDHIIPSVIAGSDEAENLAFSCRGCNGRKLGFTNGIDPLSGRNIRLFDPRNDDWYAHFSWSADFTLIIGLTGVGRATVNRLALNREGLINQRKVLAAYGVHPPE